MHQVIAGINFAELSLNKCTIQIKLMVQKLKSTYKSFGDATISRIEYQINYFNQGKEYSKDIFVFINCYNWILNKWENLRLTFNKVSQIRFVETKQRPSTIIFEALINKIDDTIIFDFFPVQIDGEGSLKEDPNSDFSVRCKSIFYEVLE